MTHRKDAARDADVLGRWRLLAEQRLDYLTQLFESGRWRRFYGEVAFLAGMCPMQRAVAEARLPLTDWIFQGTPDEFMRRLGALPLVSQPGERWLYHMSGEILGVLIARVSGKSLGTFGAPIDVPAIWLTPLLEGAPDVVDALRALHHEGDLRPTAPRGAGNDFYLERMEAVPAHQAWREPRSSDLTRHL